MQNTLWQPFYPSTNTILILNTIKYPFALQFIYSRWSHQKDPKGQNIDSDPPVSHQRLSCLQVFNQSACASGNQRQTSFSPRAREGGMWFQMSATRRASRARNANTYFQHDPGCVLHKKEFGKCLRRIASASVGGFRRSTSVQSFILLWTDLQKMLVTFCLSSAETLYAEPGRVRCHKALAETRAWHHMQPSALAIRRALKFLKLWKVETLVSSLLQYEMIIMTNI